MANTIQITIVGQNKAGGALGDAAKGLSGLSGAAKSAGGVLGGFGSALGGVATIAGGIVAANIFGKIAGGIASFASTGLEAVGSAQQLQTSLKALLTQNNMYEKSVETVTQAITQQVMSQDELGIKSAELNAKLTSQRARFQEQQQQIIQLTAAYGENGLATIRARAAHDELALKIQKTEREIAGLTTTETTYNQVTRTSVNQVLDQAEAFKLASKQTQELMDFVSQVAVISPFETEDVEMTTKFAVAAGLGVEQTKAFVPAFLDLAGAVGITSSELGFAADQLFQVKKVGKLTEIDLRQLRRLGIDLAQVIGVEMGMSVDEFNTQAEKTPEIFDELFEAVTRYSKNTFAGTSQEMATSVKGLKSTLSDVFVIGARNFWQPIVEAVTPMVSEILGKLSDFVLGGDMAGIGQKLADTLMGGLSTAESLFNIGQALGFDAAIATAAQMISNAWPSIAAALTGWGLQFWNFLEETVIPLGITAFNYLSTVIGGFIAANWPIVEAQLFTWRDQFFDWVAELYPQIPAMLTMLVQNIAAGLEANWPMINEALTEWGTLFWGWAQTAATGAATALGGLVLAMAAWATGGEGQEAMLVLGQQIGQMLVDVLNLHLSNTENTSSILLTLTGGLLAAAAGLIGTLIIVGGQIVAGIIAGILQSLGIDLQPALFSELGAILTGIGANALIIAKAIGVDIVVGILEGANSVIADINNTFRGAWENLQTILSASTSILVDEVTQKFRDLVSKIEEIFSGEKLMEIGKLAIDGLIKGMEENANKVISAVKKIVKSAIDTMLSSWGIGSPSKVTMEIGEQIVGGLILGIKEQTGALNDEIASAAEAVVGGFKFVFNQVHAELEGLGISPEDMIVDAKGMNSFLSNLKKNVTGTLTGALAGGGLGLQDIADDLIGTLMQNIAHAPNQLIEENFGQFADKMYEVAQNTLMPILAKIGRDIAVGLIAAAGSFTSLGQTASKRLVTGMEENLQAIQDQIGATTVTLDIEGEQKTVDEVVKQLEDLRELQKTDFTTERQEEIDFLNMRLTTEDQTNAAVRERINLLSQQKWAEEDLAKAQEEQLKLQQQQADLQFLQQQLGLLQTIEDLGLDPSEILGGIKLGIDADLQSIVDAMGATVDAIINQVDSTLQISSPSKVMMEKGQQIVAGLFGGITGALQGSSIMGAIGNSIAPGVTSVQNSSQRNTTNNFNMTVNTRANQSSVIQDYSVMQNLIGA